MLRYIDKIQCSSMLNVSPGTNAFLSHTWLSKFFFLTIFFILQAMWGRRGDKKAFKEMKICGVIASK